MKNLRYIIAAIFVVAIGIGIFWACEKSENYNSEKEVSKKITRKNLGYQDTIYLQYIQELSSTTGIDLLSLYQENYISEFSDAIQYHTDKLLTSIQDSDITTSYLQNLDNNIQLALSNNDTISLAEYYSVFGSILYDNGSLDEETYANQIYLFPTSNFNNLSITINNLKLNIANDYANFNALPEELQIKIIAEAIWLHQSDGGMVCGGTLEDERDRRLLKAEAIYAMAMLGCIPVGALTGGFFGVLCIATVTLTFNEAINNINEWYYSEKKNQQ